MYCDVKSSKKSNYTFKMMLLFFSQAVELVWLFLQDLYKCQCLNHNIMLYFILYSLWGFCVKELTFIHYFLNRPASFNKDCLK